MNQWNKQLFKLFYLSDNFNKNDNLRRQLSNYTKTTKEHRHMQCKFQILTSERSTMNATTNYNNLERKYIVSQVDI